MPEQRVTDVAPVVYWRHGRDLGAAFAMLGPADTQLTGQAGYVRGHWVLQLVWETAPGGRWVASDAPWTFVPDTELWPSEIRT